MRSFKPDRVAELVRQVVASAILTELRDPRIRGVTVTRVEVSADLRHAKVYVSIMAEGTEESEVLAGLESARGYLQAKLLKALKTKNIPQIRFQLDRGVKHSIYVSQVLERLEQERQRRLVGGPSEPSPPEEGSLPDRTESTSA
jgi:ribosome-binding factor A